MEKRVEDQVQPLVWAPLYIGKTQRRNSVYVIEGRSDT